MEVGELRDDLSVRVELGGPLLDAGIAAFAGQQQVDSLVPMRMDVEVGARHIAFGLAQVLPPEQRHGLAVSGICVWSWPSMNATSIIIARIRIVRCARRCTIGTRRSTWPPGSTVTADTGLISEYRRAA